MQADQELDCPHITYDKQCLWQDEASAPESVQGASAPKSAVGTLEIDQSKHEEQYTKCLIPLTDPPPPGY